MATERDAAAAHADYRAPDWLPTDLVNRLLVLSKQEERVVGIAAFYSVEPVGDDETYYELLSRRGLVVAQRETLGADAALLFESLADHPDKELVDVGPYEALLVLGTMNPWGVRLSVIAWSDGKTDWRITGNVELAEVLDVARSFYCAGGE